MSTQPEPSINGYQGFHKETYKALKYFHYIIGQC